METAPLLTAQGVSAGDSLPELSIDVTATIIANPTSKKDCKRGGWAAFGFRNQGQCVSFVQTGRDRRIR